MYTFYTMDGCSNCHKVKEHLQEQNVSYNEVNILENPKSSKQLLKLIGEVYTPVLVTDNTIIKGLDILNYSKHELH